MAAAVQSAKASRQCGWNLASDQQSLPFWKNMGVTYDYRPRTLLFWGLLMSIREQIEDTVSLFKQGRYRGAFLNAVIAVAATARKRRPRDEAKDHESFVAFLREEMGVVTGGGVWNYTVTFRNKKVRLEQVLYEFVRCTLAHEAALPPDVVIDETVPLGSLSLGLTDGRLTLSATWVDGLVRAAWFAPENANEFPEWADLPEEEMRRHLFGTRWDSPNAQEYWRHRIARFARGTPTA